MRDERFAATHKQGKVSQFDQLYDEQDNIIFAMLQTHIAKNDEALDSFFCPLTGDIMEEPYICVISQNSYEKTAIRKHVALCFERGEDPYDPLTRAVVHRDDTVDAILNIAANWDNADGQYINCGGPEVMSRQKFTEIVKKTALPTLKFKVTAPPAKFYVDRAAFSEMSSPNLEKVLGRKRHTIQEAVELEFGVGNMG